MSEDRCVAMLISYLASKCPCASPHPINHEGTLPEWYSCMLQCRQALCAISFVYLSASRQTHVWVNWVVVTHKCRSALAQVKTNKHTAAILPKTPRCVHYLFIRASLNRGSGAYFTRRHELRANGACEFRALHAWLMSRWFVQNAPATSNALCREINASERPDWVDKWGSAPVCLL